MKNLNGLYDVFTLPDIETNNETNNINWLCRIVWRCSYFTETDTIFIGLGVGHHKN